jgi:oligopeptidase B
MRRLAGGLLVLLLVSIGSTVQVAAAPALTAPSPSIAAPVAKKIPKVFEEYGRQRIDNYYWMRERDNPDVIAYLKAENAYADNRLKPIKPLAAKLYAEMTERHDDADLSVPYIDGGYYYQTRYTKGADYPVIVRRKKLRNAPMQVVLDVAKLAKGHSEFNLNNWIVSSDGALVTYAVDESGDLANQIFVRNIATGKVLDQSVRGAADDIVLLQSGKEFLYVRLESQTMRPYQVWRHRIGTNPAQDVLIYEEADKRFSVSLNTSKSGNFVFIDSDNGQTNEIHYQNANVPNGKFKVMQPRKSGVLYYPDQVRDKFYIRTNLDAPDFCIVTAPEDAPAANNWTVLVPQTPGHYLSHMELFDNYIVIDDEHDAVKSLRVFRLGDMREIAVPRPAKIGVASVEDFEDAINIDSELHVLRFGFESPLRPPTIYDFDMKTRMLTERKQQLPAEHFKPQLYRVNRVFAKAADGTTIPITLVYRKDLRRPGGNPVLITGYGAYGLSSEPVFLTTWFRLMDRGFVFAIAHIRGGREMGENWYDQGRLLNKRNTFTDFIAATEALIAQGYADPHKIFARGASAGGLLMGAIANLRPDLYAGIVAEVPFVDVVTTMSDPNIPLTAGEYEEWGNPAIKKQYDYMLSYSPYDNVTTKAYPAMFITAALNDRQVEFSEPAKWVAKLRAMKTDKHELLFKTNMNSGHAGDSGRLAWLKERAEIIAWLIVQARL